MLSPKRTKYRKHHRGALNGKPRRGTKVAFGEFGLQALQPCWLTSRQIEAGRRVLTRYVKRGGKLWIRVFPDKPVTMRAEGARMGSGKGAPEYWVAVVQPGKILYEIRGVAPAVAIHALRIAGYKMPVTTRTVRRPESPTVFRTGFKFCETFSCFLSFPFAMALNLTGLPSRY